MITKLEQHQKELLKPLVESLRPTLELPIEFEPGDPMTEKYLSFGLTIQEIIYIFEISSRSLFLYLNSIVLEIDGMCEKPRIQNYKEKRNMIILKLHFERNLTRAQIKYVLNKFEEKFRLARGFLLTDEILDNALKLGEQ